MINEHEIETRKDLNKGKKTILSVLKDFFKDPKKRFKDKPELSLIDASQTINKDYIKKIKEEADSEFESQTSIKDNAITENELVSENVIEEFKNDTSKSEEHI